MIPIKRRCRFSLDKEKGKPDARIRLRVRWNGNIASFLLGYRAEIDKWSSEAQRCKANTTHGIDKIPAFEINRTIEQFENAVHEIFYDYEVKDKVPTIEEFKADVNIVVFDASADRDLLINHYDKYISDCITTKSLSINRIKSLKQTICHLEKFNPSMRLSGFNELEMKDFINYLARFKYRNSTISKHYDNTRSFLLWCIENKIYNGDALSYKHRFKKVRDKDIIYLTWKELMSIYELKYFEKDNLKEIRDIFCFCCFTGLRYSDVKKLEHKDVHEDHIEIVTQKTVHHLKIELNKFSKAILKKYTYKYDGLVFYPYNISFVNKCLKKIAKTAKINTPVTETFFVNNKLQTKTKPKHELISSHCARRTFVVNALRLGIPSEVIMKWTGHSSHNSMKPYVAIVDELKAQEMDKFNSLDTKS